MLGLFFFELVAKGFLLKVVVLLAGMMGAKNEMEANGFSAFIASKH